MKSPLQLLSWDIDPITSSLTQYVKLETVLVKISWGGQNHHTASDWKAPRARRIHPISKIRPEYSELLRKISTGTSCFTRTPQARIGIRRLQQTYWVERAILKECHKFRETALTQPLRNLSLLTLSFLKSAQQPKERSICSNTLLIWLVLQLQRIFRRLRLRLQYRRIWTWIENCPQLSLLHSLKRLMELFQKGIEIKVHYLRIKIYCS